MKIGAGGLQSQIIEDSVKQRDIDPVRNKPGHDEALAASQIAGQEKVKQNLTKRPVNKALKDSEVNNHQKVNRQQEREEQQNNKENRSKQDQKKDQKRIDIYI